LIQIYNKLCNIDSKKEELKEESEGEELKEEVLDLKGAKKISKEEEEA